MAKIGTAHLEIKPVVNDEALAQITAAIEKAVAAGVEAGMRAARPEPVTYTGDIYVHGQASPGVFSTTRKNGQP